MMETEYPRERALFQTFSTDTATVDSISKQDVLNVIKVLRPIVERDVPMPARFSMDEETLCTLLVQEDARVVASFALFAIWYGALTVIGDYMLRTKVLPLVTLFYQNRFQPGAPFPYFNDATLEPALRAFGVVYNPVQHTTTFDNPNVTDYVDEFFTFVALYGAPADVGYALVRLTDVVTVGGTEQALSQVSRSNFFVYYFTHPEANAVTRFQPDNPQLTLVYERLAYMLDVMDSDMRPTAHVEGRLAHVTMQFLNNVYEDAFPQEPRLLGDLVVDNAPALNPALRDALTKALVVLFSLEGDDTYVTGLRRTYAQLGPAFIRQQRDTVPNIENTDLGAAFVAALQSQFPKIDTRDPNNHALRVLSTVVPAWLGTNTMQVRSVLYVMRDMFERLWRNRSTGSDAQFAASIGAFVQRVPLAAIANIGVAMDMRYTVDASTQVATTFAASLQRALAGNALATVADGAYLRNNVEAIPAGVTLVSGTDMYEEYFTQTLLTYLYLSMLQEYTNVLRSRPADVSRLLATVFRRTSPAALQELGNEVMVYAGPLFVDGVAWAALVGALQVLLLKREVSRAFVERTGTFYVNEPPSVEQTLPTNDNFGLWDRLLSSDAVRASIQSKETNALNDALRRLPYYFYDYLEARRGGSALPVAALTIFYNVGPDTQLSLPEQDRMFVDAAQYVRTNFGFLRGWNLQGFRTAKTLERSLLDTLQRDAVTQPLVDALTELEDTLLLRTLR